MVKVIRAEVDGLREVAKVFAHHADLSVALAFQIERLVDQLQGGAWRGIGAETFYAEMCELVLPAMRKLQDALQFARDSTLTIIEIMQAAEDEAAALFRGLPGEEISHPQQDDEERRKQLLHMLKETLRLSGLLDSPLPDDLEFLTVAELETLLDSNENAERSRITLGKLVLWALDKVHSSALENAFWKLSADQRYELLTALTWLMERLSRGEVSDSALLDNLSEPVRGLMLTTLLNVVQRFRLAQTDERVRTEIEYQHTIHEIGGAAFADWIGNLNLFWAIGSRFYSPGGGGGGGRSPYGTSAEIPLLTGKTREEAEAILSSYDPIITSGNYTKYKFADKSEIWIGPDGVIDRIPKPMYNPDGSRVLGFRVDPISGNLARAHTFLEEILRK